jgi:uncharacterized protein (TIGR02246 family)
LSAPPSRDEPAVREVVKKYLEARERHDVDALRALFTEDADQLVSSGEWRKGREAVVKGTLASSAQTTGARTITVQNVRFPARDVAIADGPYEIAGGQDAAARKMWSSFVMVRTNGAWKISAIRNMLPAPAAVPAR